MRSSGGRAAAPVPQLPRSSLDAEIQSADTCRSGLNPTGPTQFRVIPLRSESSPYYVVSATNILALQHQNGHGFSD
jgi:hypothetical protein